MQNNDLNELASELKIASVTDQPEVTPMGLNVGSGSQSDIFGGSIPTIVVTPPSDFPMSEMWSNLGDVFGGSASDYSSSGGGTSGGGGASGSGSNPNNGQTPGANINDRLGVLSSAKKLLNDALNASTDSGETKKYREALQKAIAVIEAMGKSSSRYRVELMADNNDRNANANVHYDPITGEIVIRFELVAVTNIALIAHELTHIDQLMNGDLWVEGETVTGYDIGDEVEAYQIQHDLNYPNGDSGNYDLNGDEFPGGGYRVTPEDVRKSDPYYENLSNERLTISGSGVIPSSASASMSASN